MKPMISVIGSVFVDIKGMSFAAVKKDSKNLGKVVLSHGGVARNVAENLKLMGLDCAFVSTVNDDVLGVEVIQRLNKVGVNTDYIEVRPEGMGLWLAVIDGEGDLIASVSQQPNLQLMEEVVLERIEELCQQSQAIALDLDLTLPLAEKVVATCQKYNLPLYGVVGNMDIVGHHPHILRGMDCFVCNQEEAELLLETKIHDVAEAKKAVLKLADFGCTAAVITLGGNGAVYYDAKTNEHGHFASEKVDVVDSTGAGDAFFSGVVYELVQGRTIGQAVATGTKVARVVIQIPENNLIEPLQLEEYHTV